MKSPNPFSLGPSVKEGESAIDVVERTIGYKKWLTVEDYVLRSRKFDGSMSGEYRRALTVIGGSGRAAVVLPYDPVRDVVVMIEQMRLAAYVSRHTDGWTLEPPAGVIEVDEVPELAARREALEESGVVIKRMEAIATYMPSPGICTEVIHLFVGEVEAGESGNVGGMADEHEDIRAHVIAFDEALRLADNNQLDNANSLVAINWLARNRERLRKEWQAEDE